MTAGYLFNTAEPVAEPEPPTADEIEVADNALVSELLDAIEDWEAIKRVGRDAVDVAGVLRRVADDYEVNNQTQERRN